MAGNPNIREASKLSTGPRTEIGKFRSSMNAVRGNRSNKFMDIPKRVRELYNFFKDKDTKQINQLMELKNLAQTFKALSIHSIIERLELGEVPNKREMDLLRLWKETLVDTHKLEFGDKRVIEHNVTVSDIRRQMMLKNITSEIDKKKYNAEAQQRFREKKKNDEVIEGEFRQDSNNSGSGENAFGQRHGDGEDLEVPEDLQEDSQYSQD